MKKRILGILLICCMVLTMLPVTVLAEEIVNSSNAAEVTAKLEAIDKAKAELTDVEIDELDITRYMAATAALGSLAAPTPLANSTPDEQFNLALGGTYCIDLSSENIPGTRARVAIILIRFVENLTK